LFLLDRSQGIEAVGGGQYVAAYSLASPSHPACKQDGSRPATAQGSKFMDIIPTLTATLTTIAFVDSSLQWFEACT